MRMQSRYPYKRKPFNLTVLNGLIFDRAYRSWHSLLYYVLLTIGMEWNNMLTGDWSMAFIKIISQCSMFTWSSSFSHAQCGHAHFTKLLVLWGMDQQTKPINDTWLLHVEEMKWSQVSCLATRYLLSNILL